MKNILNVKKVSLKPILMSLAILFNVFAINGTVAFASLNGELNDSQQNLAHPIGNSNGAKNVDNGIGNSKPMFENLYETYNFKDDPDDFFLTNNFLKNISSENDNNCNDDNKCNNNSKDNGQQDD